MATTSASATALAREGSLGMGAGVSSGKPSWAKNATSARPAAAVRPRKAKAVLRIRSGNPLPATLESRRNERSLVWKVGRTSSCIDSDGPARRDRSG